MQVDGDEKATKSAIGVLGYGGAAAAIAATGVALGDVTDTPVRVGVNLATVLVLLVVGWLVGSTRDDAFHRMRSVFWFVALFPWGDLMGIAAGPDGMDFEGKWMSFAVAMGIAALAWPLWVVERRSLQLIGAFLSLNGAAVALAYSERSALFLGTVPNLTPPALVTLAFGAIAFALGALGVVKPPRTALVFGSLAAIIGALMVDVELLSMTPGTGAIVLALAVAVVAMLVGDLMGQRAPAGIGIAGTLLLVSALVEDQVKDQGPAVVVLALGLAMLGATVILVRSRRMPAAAEAPPAPAATPDSPLPPGPEA